MHLPRLRATALVLPLLALVTALPANAARASSPVAAVRAVDSTSLPRTGCNPITGKLAACPITDHLRAQLKRDLQWQRVHTRGGNGNAFCRCQNPPRSANYRLMSKTPTRALVQTVQHYGADTFALTWVVLKGNAGWLVEDNYCSGRPGTSLYSKQQLSPGPC